MISKCAAGVKLPRKGNCPECGSGPGEVCHKAIARDRQQLQQLCDYLVQIRNVCRDNAPETCNHRMALDFVHQVSAAALSSTERGQ